MSAMLEQQLYKSVVSMSLTTGSFLQSASERPLSTFRESALVALLTFCYSRCPSTEIFLPAVMIRCLKSDLSISETSDYGSLRLSGYSAD